MEKNYFGSIEFGALTIKVLVLCYYQSKLSVVASSSVSSKGYYNGEITDIDAFNASINNALVTIEEKYKIKVDELILILPNNNHKVYSAFVSNKVLTERQIIGINQINSIRNQIKEAKVNDSEILVDEVPTLYSLDNDRQLRTAPVGQRSSILAIKSNVHTLPKTMVENLKCALKYNNVNIIGQIINCNCAIRATLSSYELENQCIHINVLEEVTTISAFYKNILLKSVTVNFGIETLIIYLAKTLNVSKDYAKELFNSYFICDVDCASDIIFNEELNLSERRISGIILNRLYNAFNEILDACNELSINCNFTNDYYLYVTGYLNDCPYFVNEFSKYSSLNIKEANMQLIGLDSQEFINCYGAIISFINLNPEYVKSRFENEEEINISQQERIIINEEKSNSSSRFKDIFED